MDKTEAFKIVFDELQKVGMFTGKYDARSGNEHFMYGIATVMESIAYSIDEKTGDDFSKTFDRNMDESEGKRMSDLRPAAIYWHGIDVSESLSQLLSTQPEIVRCKDCRYYDAHECKHPRALIFSEDDDFCSHAERRTDGTN